MILSFLATHWRAIALLGIVLAVAGYIGILKIEVRHCNTERETLQKQVDGLKGAIEAQNAAVAALKAAGAAKIAKATKGLAAARTASLGSQKEAERLMIAASAKSALGACLAADGVRVVREGL